MRAPSGDNLRTLHLQGAVWEAVPAAWKGLLMCCKCKWTDRHGDTLCLVFFAALAALGLFITLGGFG